MVYHYDPELDVVIKHLPALDLGNLDGTRELMAQLAAELSRQALPEGIEALPMKATSAAHEVTLRVVRPTIRRQPTAALIWFHGGGFVFGDADTETPFLAPIADLLGITILSVEYSLSPEARYPQGINEGYAALEWVADNAAELGVDASRIAVGGRSAGGCFAAAVALMARDRNGPAIAFQALDIPVLDDRLASPSMLAYFDTPLWNRQNARISWEHYLGAGVAGDVSPYAAPARARDLTALPPAFISACQYDPLRDEAIEYAARLSQADVSVELHVYPGTFHGSTGIAPGAAVSLRMYDDLIQALGRALGSSTSA